MARKSSPNTICDNRRAYYDYELVEEFEAGLALEGWEVKSLRDKRAQIAGAYVKWLGDELFLIGSHINPLQTINTHKEYKYDRSRKLLLHKKEINKIKGALQKKGLSCVPLKLKWKGQLVKCFIAIARGKKLHDKRETIKERDLQRSSDRELKL